MIFIETLRVEEDNKGDWAIRAEGINGKGMIETLMFGICESERKEKLQKLLLEISKL